MLTYDNRGRIVSLLILVAAVALMTAQYVSVGQGSPGPVIQLDPSLVEKGREAFGQACLQCHGTNRATIQRKSEESWRGTVYSMISRGSNLMPDEIEPVIAYLTATYGPGSAPPGSADSPGSDALPDEPGREILVSSCVQCHAMEMILEAKKSEPEWKQTVDRMVGYGADVTPEQQNLVVKYASAHFGPR
jgi:mono/diheme cytochrome c family protein